MASSALVQQGCRRRGLEEDARLDEEQRRVRLTPRLVQRRLTPPRQPLPHCAGAYYHHQHVQRSLLLFRLSMDLSMFASLKTRQPDQRSSLPEHTSHFDHEESTVA